MDLRREGESNVDWFNQYVMNDIPIRLIRLSNMKFVERNEVREQFQRFISATRLDGLAELVKYAILSHRWLDAGELTYEEMRSGRRRGPGYRKLKRFCETARAYNMEFAWVDTCCIDKNSSTEIDESIRSMFRWYRNSALCIVHLAQSETIQDIMRDEWTKRGWTLQELLAPRSMKLFNKHWMPMTGYENDKSPEGTGVMKTLQKVTGIPLHYLWTFDPGPVKVDERMKWAARREITRVEDVAYSLMGIFDVSMQIAYGEGGDRAFCRLIEAIMQAGDPSVLNWIGEAARNHSSGVIPLSPRSYVGRASLHLGEKMEMTMTSLGLRVPLVILPLCVSSTNNQRATLGYDEVTLEFVQCPAVQVDFLDYVAAHRTRQFAFGIVNYSIRSSQLPRIRGKSTGFILNRGLEGLYLPRVPICEPSSEDFVGLNLVSPPKHEFDAWKKVQMTGLKEIDFPNILSDSYFYVSPEYLESVYL
ncbi:HET-domain-containing protein [Rhizopogon vinicolor AM-OR11-026]|uniref:HET-domain-containing protein n=1 Tax=Rhizopogon vinicolor AM-OR11-026 TaxID=1314800 RepID=A0A1B7MF93_9AGAM|nr:HET-domain-containing protein [Rhizopogon vinicolor AM-OR11-026]